VVSIYFIASSFQFNVETLAEIHNRTGPFSEKILHFIDISLSDLKKEKVIGTGHSQTVYNLIKRESLN
jgi:hypothetical protein